MPVSIGERVRTGRKALHLSQEEVARRAGVSLNQVNRLERGEIVDPHFSTLAGLATALDMQISELVGEPTVPLAEAPETGPSAELPQRSFPSEAREPEELSGWARSALEESKFVERFEQAKLASEEAARQFHREEVEAEKQAANRLRELQARNAPWGEILAAGRDREIAAARMSATAFLWTEILGGRDVSALDPVEIVGDALAARRDLFAEEGASRPPKPASGASEVEAG